jgi:hypothetical protein
VQGFEFPDGYYVASGAGDRHLDLEQALSRELISRLGSKRYARLLVVIHRDCRKATENR